MKIVKLLPLSLSKEVESRISSEKNVFYEKDGYKFKILGNSQRLRFFHKTILEKKTRCVCCGLEATHFGLHKNGYNHTLELISDQGFLFTHDHILARSLGGSDELDNIQLLCRECNAIKGFFEQNQQPIFYEEIRNKKQKLKELEILNGDLS